MFQLHPVRGGQTIRQRAERFKHAEGGRRRWLLGVVLLSALSALFFLAPPVVRADSLRAEQRAAPLTRVELRLAERSVPEGLALADVYTALDAAARAWSYPAIGCTSVVATVGEPSRARLVGQDGTNLVIFRQERWCLNERCGGNRTFPLRAAAMTNVYPNETTVEGDIELNAVSIKWDRAPQTRDYLSVVLAHELGHVLGLSDVCATAHGKPVLEGCTERDSIMFAPARLPKPSPRDVMQLCRRFPRATLLPAAQSTGVSMVALAVASTLATLLLALQLLVTRRAEPSSAQHGWARSALRSH